MSYSPLSRSTLLMSSVDLGTNTCLLLIAEVNPQTQIVTKTVEDHSTIVRLGKGVDQARRFAPEAMDRAFECLKKYSRQIEARGLKAQDTVCVATSQARDAQNSQEFFDRIERELGFRFKVISGDQEARATFLGALLPGMKAQDYAVIDIGGGSTELMSLDPGTGKETGQSLDIGSVRFTERYLKTDPVTDAGFWQCQEQIDAALCSLKPWRRSLAPQTQLLAVAGTATTLASWHIDLKKFDAHKINSVELTSGDLHRQVEELKWRTVAECRQLTGIEPERADVLLAGAMILWRCLEVLEFKSCRVSTRGLRYGVFSALFSSKTNR